MRLEEYLQVAQLISSILTLLAVIFAFLQVRFSAIQTKRQADKSSIEFVLSSEGQFDGMSQSLLAESPSVIRRIFGEEIDTAWSDDEVKSFVYFHRYYGHISRMIYIIGDKSLEIGMNPKEREVFLQPWRSGLSRYREDKIMRRIHENGKRLGNYNKAMLQLSREVFESQ